MIDKNDLENFSFAGLCIVVSILVFFVFKPFLQILTLAVAFAVILHLPYEKLLHFFEKEKNTVAGVVVLASLLLFIVPIFMLGMEIFQEAQGLYTKMLVNEVHYVEVINQAIDIPVRHFFPDFSFDIADYLLNTLGFISDNLAVLVTQTFLVLFETFLMLLASFFFLRDGRNMLSSFIAISPFGVLHTREFLDKMYLTINAVIKGTLFTAILRWILVSLAFYFFNIPDALLWGSIAGIVGAVPGFGTPVSIIPAVVYLAIIGNNLSAVLLAIFGVVVVVFVDNWLTAYFFGRGFNIPSIFMLFSILGGVLFFGPLGFILGPLVLSLFLSLLHTHIILKTAK